jgi:putative sigma-54 modulation protein
MKIEVRGHGVTVSETLAVDLKKRVYSAVDRFEPHVSAVRVQIFDDNGPRGGEDKRCVVVAQGDHIGKTVVTARSSTVLGAVGAASDTLGRTLRGAVDRQKQKAHERAQERPRPWTLPR